MFDNWGHSFVTYNINHIQQRLIPTRYLNRFSGFPPIEATEKNPVRVCSALSVGARSWIAVWVETDNTRDCGAGSMAV